MSAHEPSATARKMAATPHSEIVAASDALDEHVPRSRSLERSRCRCPTTMIDVLGRGSRATGRVRECGCSADVSRANPAVPLRSAWGGLPGVTVLRGAEGAAATLAPVPQPRVDFLERAFVRGRNEVAGRSWLKSPQGHQCHNRACTERSLSDAAPRPRNADRRHRGERRPGDPDGESRDPCSRTFDVDEVRVPGSAERIRLPPPVLRRRHGAPDR